MSSERNTFDLDNVDRAILSALSSDGRQSVHSVARRVNLSRPAVHERIRRLKERGILRGFTARLDWEALGLPIRAYIAVHTSARMRAWPALAETIANCVRHGALIEEVHRTSGEWCYLAKVRVESVGALEHLIDGIRDLPGVERTSSTVVLSAFDPAEPTVSAP